MINRINTMMEKNLELLYKSENKFLNLYHFKDDLGKKFQDPKSFARLMQIKKLISKHCEHQNSFELTEFGKEIYKNGGWLNYIKSQNEKVIAAKKTILPMKKRNKWYGFF